MGYAFVIGPCLACKKMFTFNPVRVPSFRINGVKEPLCRDCVEYINPKRIANGLDPIVPHKDAYEACDESELG